MHTREGDGGGRADLEDTVFEEPISDSCVTYLA